MYCQRFIKTAATALFISALLPAASTLAYEFSDKQLANAEKLMSAAMKDDIGYQLVESLTTEVGPRLAGSEAEARARDWAQKELKKLGFKNIAVEEFPVPLWERGIERAEVLSPFPQALSITALGGSVATPKAGVEGILHTVPSLAALAKVKDGALAGKIVFVDESMARTQDGSGYGAAVAKRRQTAFDAHRTGAVAALIRSVGTSNHRFPHTGQMKRLTEGPAENSVPTAALSAPDADQLARMSKRSDTIRLRVVLTPEIRPPSTSGNVIAEIPGRSKEKQIVLVGAHLDSWDLGTGAVDDGAGVGIVVAAANLVKSMIKEKPSRTIRVVLFGSEEVGLVGAKSYAETHAQELNAHVIAAESDFGADIIWRFRSGNVSEEKLPAIKALQSVFSPLKIVPGDNAARGGPDLFFMNQAGVTVADLTQDGRDYFDLHHTADDTFDKIEINKLRQNIAVYAAFLYLTAYSDISFR